MEMIITAATVATMFFNSATSESNNYFYNAQMEDGKVETLSVMKKDEYGEVTEKMDYAMVLDNVMAINHYECVKGETMELKSNMLVMNPDERLLASKWTAEVF